jgi:hypothetical protein
MLELIYDVRMTKEEKDAVYDAIHTVLDLEEKVVASDDEWDESEQEDRERSRRYHVVLRELLDRL